MQSDCIDPIQSYVVQFAPIHDILDQRKKVLLEFDYRRDKVKNLTEKPGKDPLALPRAKEKLSKAKEDYEYVNNQAKEQMQTVIRRHEEVFEPMIENVCRNF